MQNIQKYLDEGKNILFVKESCTYCSATKKLASKLEAAGIVEPFQIFTLHEDFEQAEITDLLKNYGWEPKDTNDLVALPQVYIQGEYIGSNNKFYDSKYNLGDENNQIEVGGKLIETPNKINPMNF